MGTVVVLDLYVEEALEREVIRSLVSSACAILHRADELFSTWNLKSPVSRLRCGDATLEQMPNDVLAVLKLCANAREVSEGWFDPWAMPGGVDPTGYVKGWAAQRALLELQHRGVLGAMVNAAGDIATCSGPGVTTPFRIGITDPWARRQIACVVEVDAAIATSGTYERGDHLVDPRSGLSGSRVASASVTGPDLGLADALATGLAVAGRDFLELLEGLEGYEGFVIENDGSWSHTTAFPLSRESSESEQVRARIRRARATLGYSEPSQ